MYKEVFEVEAGSLELARKKAEAKISKGRELLSEQILCDGKPQSVNAFADTLVAAFEEAHSMVPEGCEIIEEKEIFSPTDNTFEIKARKEKKAKSKALSLSEPNTKIKEIRLKVKGEKGFLGIGKTSNIYEVDVHQPAVVEIVFKCKARIMLEVKKSIQILDKKELKDLATKIYVGMSIYELIELIGKPSTTMSDSDMFSLFSNAPPPKRRAGKENWLYESRYGNFQLIILNGCVIEKSDLARLVYKLSVK